MSTSGEKWEAVVGKSKRGRKRKGVVLRELAENLAGRKRVLRSDVAKQREREAEAAEKRKKKTNLGKRSVVIVLGEGSSLGDDIDGDVARSDIDEQSGKGRSDKERAIDDGVSSEEIVTEELASGSSVDACGDAVFEGDGADQLECREDNHSIVAEEDGIDKKDAVAEEKSVLSERNGIEDKEYDKELQGEPSTKFKSGVNNNVKVGVENRRLTRSSFAKLMEDGEADVKKIEEVTSEADAGENCSVGYETMIKIAKNVKVGKRKVMKSTIAKQRDEGIPGSVFKRKRGRPPSGANTKGKKNLTDSTSSCKQEQTAESEGEKLKISSSNGRVSDWKQVVPITTQKGFYKKVTGAEKADRRMTMDKTLSVKKDIQHEDRVEQKPFPLGETKCADILNCSHLTKEEKRSKMKDLMMAKKNLRDKIKGILLNSGWKIDLRPRRGTKSIDAVYVSPEGYTHWSIVKAYYAFKKQFNCDDDESKLSRNLHKKSQKACSASFSPIPEEVLRILKHRISRRRTNKEIEEANMKLGSGTISKKQCQLKGGKRKGRGEETEGKKSYQGKFRKLKKRCGLLGRSSNRGSDVYIPYAWQRTVLSWVIDLGIISENATVTCMNRTRTKALLKGQMTRGGINCSCCSKIFTVSDFEIHSGSKQCKPYRNIVVEESGTSLSQCLIKAWEKQDESKRRGFHSVDIREDDLNDDTCGICGDGGDLICCDGCPSTFHQSCLGSEMLPQGDWYCMNCSCRYCRIGIVAEENDGTDSTLLSCSQCEEKYHRKCIPEEDAIPARSNRLCNPFCGLHCKKVFEKLRKLLGVKNLLDAGLSWTIVQRMDDDLPESVCTLEQRAECNSKIAVAHAVMDECFFPILHQRSGIEMIHSVVYNCGSNFNRLNYRGFYTFILERGDEVISVASLRIHGTRVAEMPLIGTRMMYRHQGMCRRLLHGIESALCSLNVEKLVIPAISELMDTWTKVFGFKQLEASQKEEIKSINLMMFPDTGLLVKTLLEEESIGHCRTSDKGETEIAAQDLPLQPMSVSLDEPLTKIQSRKESLVEHETRSTGETTIVKDANGHAVDADAEVVAVYSRRLSRRKCLHDTIRAPLRARA